MKLFRKLTAILTALAMTAAFLPVVTFAASEPGVKAKLSESNATIHGRYTKEKHKGVDTYTFSHGAAGFGVNFTGSEFWINIPETPEWDGVREVGISVRVDSDYAMDAKMVNINRTGWICVASGLGSGEHHIEIRKQSRGFYGIMASDWVAISEIGVATGKQILAPDPLSDLIIECYGDSITNGDAVWYNEDGTNSAYTNGNWTGVLERLLGAEVRVTGNTGNGLLGWVMSTKNGSLDNLLPPQNNWDKIDPNHGGGTWSHEGDNAADVVIINLGTNDRGELGNGDLTHKAFSDEYVRFIKQIHNDCPDAIVICTIGAMGGQKEWSDTIGGAGIDYVEYEWKDGEFTRTIVENDAIQNLLGASIATVGKAFDSGVTLYNESMSADRINDANTSTGWQAKEPGAMGENCYAGIMFDHAVTCTGAKVDWEAGSRAARSTAGYRVEVTTDGKTWAVPAGISYEYDPSTDGVSSDKITFNKTAILGIRVVVLSSVNSKYAAQIYELGVESEERAASMISEKDIKHVDSVIDRCNAWAGETFCYFVEIQKCDTIGANCKVSSLKDGKATDIPAGAGYDNGHPSNLAGEVYGLQYATLINKVLNLGKDLPTDIPAYAFEKRIGKTAPSGSILKAVQANDNTLSYIDDVIKRAENGKDKPGDVNGDGEVGADDLTALARHVGKIELITDEKRLRCCDLDGVEGVGADDLTKLARIVAQIE